MAQRTFNLADLFEIACETIPSRLAMVQGEQILTYEQLNSRANKVANYMQNIGIKAGDNVGLQLHNSPVYLEAFFACCKIGAIPFNVNYRYVGAELAYLYDNANIVMLFSSTDAQTIAKACLDIGTLKHIVFFDEVDDCSVFAPNINIAYYQQMLTQSGEEHCYQKRDNDQMILYTGGTTGKPKGVIWPHKSLFFASLGGGGWYHADESITTPQQLVSRIEEGPHFNIFPVAPLMHGAALWTALGSLLVGQTIVLNPQEQFVAENIWQTVADKQVNILSIVGDAMALPLVEALEQDRQRWDLSHFFALGSGGAVLSDHLQTRIKGQFEFLSVHSSLGATETGALGMASSAKGKGGMLSYPARDDLCVVIEGRIAQPSEEGLLARRGYLPIGYYADPEKTAATFMNINGVAYAVSGDLARVESDNSITILGRGSSCINTGGEKVYPEEVKQVLVEHNLVQDAMVVGVSHPRWGEIVCAVIELRINELEKKLKTSMNAVEQENIKQQLTDDCRQKMANYKVPKVFCFVDTIEYTVVGKPKYQWAQGLFKLNPLDD